MKISSALPLFIRINRKLEKLSNDLDHARDVAVLAKEPDTQDAFYLDDSIGRSLHNIYCSIEGILEDIAGDIDGSRPNGNRYHMDLLDQMTSDTPLRPAAISDSSELRDLMRFRHLFRNLYGDPLRRNELLEKVQVVDKVIIPDMLGSLEKLNRSLEAVSDPFEAVEIKEAGSDPSDPKSK